MALHLNVFIQLAPVWCLADGSVHCNQTLVFDNRGVSQPQICQGYHQLGGMNVGSPRQRSNKDEAIVQRLHLLDPWCKHLLPQPQQPIYAVLAKFPYDHFNITRANVLVFEKKYILQYYREIIINVHVLVIYTVWCIMSAVAESYSNTAPPDLLKVFWPRFFGISL